MQQVFDQQKQQNEANHQATMKSKLDQDVKDGKLTQDQENKIIAKLQEVKTFMYSLKDKSAADRRTAMQKEMTDLQQWAKDNNIPTQYIHMGMGRGDMMGHRGMMRGAGHPANK